MKQRGLIRWLSLLLGLVLIAGCSQAGVATQSSSQAGAASGQGIKKPRVAFVYLGPPGDGGWTYQHDQGRKYLENQLGIKADYVENVPESADAERVLTQLAQNHDIIFATSFGYQDYVYDVAQKFPHVIFMHCAGYKTAPNMGTYFGRNYQASYLAGVAAGKMTKKNLLGYVGAFPIPEVIYNINAFTRGAQSVNPKVKVKVVWSNTWFDPATERQAAGSLLDQGVDVVAAYQDSPASLQAAQERGAYAIGNDSDMGRYVPDAYITNPVWNWGPYYVKVVKEVMDGTWKSGQYLGGLKDGMVGLAPFGKNVPQDVQNLVEKDKEEITAGKLDPFHGPIYDASGELRVPAGSKLTDQQILSMNWFVQGVEGTIPK